MEQALAILPEKLRQAVTALPERDFQRLEELRLRAGQEAAVVLGGRERPLPIPVNAADIQAVVVAAAGHSLYAAEDQLRQGYRTLRGAHRLGICGTAVRSADGIGTLRQFCAVNLRFARSIPGAAEPAYNLLREHPASVLILGSPGRGKTTVLRDLIRILSDRLHFRVGVADERGEIAAVLDGQPQFRLGRSVDVLTGTTKQEGINMLLRTMSPEWIALDEISEQADVEAIVRASYCGVRFAATAHVWEPGDLRRRPLYRALMRQGVFENLIYLQPDRTLRCERLQNE